MSKKSMNNNTSKPRFIAYDITKQPTKKRGYEIINTLIIYYYCDFKDNVDQINCNYCEETVFWPGHLLYPRLFRLIFKTICK